MNTPNDKQASKTAITAQVNGAVVYRFASYQAYSFFYFWP